MAHPRTRFPSLRRPHQLLVPLRQPITRRDALQGISVGCVALLTKSTATMFRIYASILRLEMTQSVKPFVLPFFDCLAA